ncbi:MAG: hypothetical protein AB7C89_08880 [Intestinibacillus sp.]
MLYAASVAPTGQAGLCAAAGVVPAAPLSHRQVALGVSVYSTSAVLGLLLLPKKSIAFAYIAVFGAYTLVKYAIEKLRSGILQWICKLGYASCALALVMWLMPALLMPAARLLPDSWEMRVAFAVAAVLYYVIFAVYDIAFSRLITLLRRVFSSE